jgi:hypothetical protein
MSTFIIDLVNLKNQTESEIVIFCDRANRDGAVT